MKRHLTISLPLILFGLLTISYRSIPPHDTGPAKRGCNIVTGAPGQGTCCTCHTGPAANGDFKIEEVFHNNTPGSGYYYQGSLHAIISELLSADTFQVGGIQMIALDTAGNSTGAWLPGNTTNSNNAPVVTCNGIDVVEQPHGIAPLLTSITGQLTHRIYLGAIWIADPTYAGTVNFYAAGIAADDDSTVHGDVCYRSTLQLLPAAPLSITPFVPLDPVMETFSDSVGGFYQRSGLTLIYPTTSTTDVKIEVIDLSGRTAVNTTATLNVGTVHFVPMCLAQGYYLFQVTDLKTEDFFGFKMMVR